MIVRCLGYVAVTTAGTPIPLSTKLAAAGLAADYKAHELQFWPRLGNTGIVYVGLDTSAPGNVGTVAMVKATGVNVLKELQKPATTGQQDHLTICSDGNNVRLADYAVDAAVNGEGFSIYAIEH